MKSISESIIGRRGALPEIWILFPMKQDYDLANEIFPMECKILVGREYSNISDYVFCTDDVQLIKRYFKSGYPKYRGGGEFPCPYSKLCVVDKLHFKNITRIKEWIQSVESVDDIYQSIYVTVIDIPKYIKSL